MRDSLDARGCGAAAAVAGQSQRRMREWARRFPGLYDHPEFDPALYGTLAQAASFSGPWYDADRLDVANKACLWAFALDWLVDYQTKDPDELRVLLDGVLEVAGGGRPKDELTTFLAELRDEVTGRTTPDLAGVWLEELRLMLDAMKREWRWKAGETRPDLETYLGNAANLGFSFVFVSHWIVNGASGDLAAVRAGSHAVERVIRLLNDLGTYERDLKWGDLNALLLGVDRSEVEERVTDLAAEAVVLLEPLPPEHGGYMRRQMEFCTGFYGITDYWGAVL